MIPLDLEERVEDAICALLASKVPGEIRVYSAWNFTTLQYPCVIVHAAENEGAAGEDAGWHQARNITVTADILVESSDEKAGGVKVRIPRERNRLVRSAVIGALAVDTLLDELRAIEVQGVVFSQAVLVGATRGVDEARRMMTTLRLFVIAGPAEL